jgi:hypothetical protein
MRHALYRYLLFLSFWAVACSESSAARDSTTASGGSSSGGTGGSAGMGATDSGTNLGTLTRFESKTPLVLEGTWDTGAPIIIESANGDIKVVRGTGDAIVRATFTPFVYRRADAPDSEVKSDLDRLSAEVQPDADGVLVRSTRAEGSPSTLGADIVVEIPAAFDATLSIRQNNGETDVSFAGNAKGIALESSDGSCNVACSATATALNIFCDHGDVAVDVPGAPAGNDVRSIRTDLGDIALSFAKVPAAQRFSVEAVAREGMVQITGGATCQARDESAGSKVVSCHGAAPGDPVYQINAATQSDILLTF